MKDGYKVGGYDKHPTADPIKGSPYEKMSDAEKQKVKRHFRVTQKQKRRIDVDEEKSTAKKLIEWVRKQNADKR